MTSGSDQIIEQITKQLNKLIDVVKLIDLAESAHIERELMLVKVKTTEANREEIRSMTGYFSRQDTGYNPSHLCHRTDRAVREIGCFYCNGGYSKYY